MPTYSFFETKCPDHIWTTEMTYAEREEYLSANPNVQQTLCAPAFGQAERMGFRKPDDGFRDVLRRIKSKHLRSTVETY